VADNQALTDDELLAVAKSGDSSLLRALTPEEKNRVVTLSQQQTPRRGLFGVDVSGVETPGAGTPDGVTLGEFRDNPSAAMSHLGGVLKDNATDPKNWAALAAAAIVPKVIGGAGDGVQAVRDNFGDPIKAAIGKRLGVDSDALDLQAARLRLQAARSRTRQATFERKQAESAATPPEDPSAAGGRNAPQPLIMTPEQLQMHQGQMANAALLAREQGMRSAAYGSAAWRNRQAAPQPASTLPVETSAASAPRAADAPAPDAKSAVPPSSSSNPMEALRSAGLSPEEADQAIRWVRQGVELDQVVKRIDATRALLRAKPALKDLPTLEQALKEVRSR
jgi:hypothetical protein